MSDYTDPEALFMDDPGSLEEVVDEDDAEDLRLDDVATKVWLVKVPKFLADRWRSIDEDDKNLGSIRIYNRAPEGRSSTISLVLPPERENDQSEEIIKEYAITIHPGEVQNKFVFTEDKNGQKSISGTVFHECTATPANIHQYKQVMKRRVEEAERPVRTTQQLGQAAQPVFVPGASSSMPSSSFSDFIPQKKQKTDKEKATRMPRNELMDALFAAFDKFPYWSFKGIAEHTNQPSQYLKEVLAEICVLNKRGPYTGNYQLKPEFKQRLSAAEKQGAAPIDLLDDDVSDDNEDEDEMEDVKL